MNISFSKRIRAAFCILLSLLMLLSFCSCGRSGGVSKTKLPDKGLSVQNQKEGNTHLHTSAADASELTKVTASGLVELLFDESDYAVCVRDTSYDKLWTSLPSDENFEACVASVEIVSGDKLYELNTQDNSVAFGKASAKISDDGVEVSYILTPDSKTAGKSSFSKSDIAFKLNINYTLTDGSLYITAKTENLVANSSARLTKLNLLGYFGASSQAQQGDFIFVPDGSGAIIKTDTEDESFKKPLEFAIYGEDTSAAQADSGKYSAVVPAYGIKQGNSAFVMLISEGDALATISADRVRDGNSFFRVGSSFDITSGRIETDGKKKKLYLADDSYDGEIGLCVRFLNGSNANYTGMAAAAREQLIRDRVLSTKTVESTGYLPLDLSVIGSADRLLFSFWKFSPTVSKVYTSFEQAQDMVMRMKAKGINGINLRYKGALSGGYDQSDLSSASILRRLGSGKDLEELCSYMSAQNMEIYLDVNLLSSSTDGSFSSRKTAENISGDEASYSYESDIAPTIGKKSYQKELLRIDKLGGVMVKMLSNSKYGLFNGFCINDAGSLLYSDFSCGKNRQESADIISEELTTLTAGRTLMTDTGNFFMIKNVRYISNVPMNAAAPTGEAYESIPFVQLVLHGIIEYSSEPLNFEEDIQTAMLRCIEYGACPSYEWSYKQSAEKNDVLYYENWLNSAAEFYTRANDALGDVRSSRMTSHTEVADGVFCTEYDTGAMIYVNYTDSDVVVSGITIPAGDFLRIN